MRNKLERAAAFRQLQGISKQLHFLTRGSMSIDSFELPESCNVRPVKANERRAVVHEGGRDLHVIVNNDTGLHVPVVPLEVHDIKLLSLMLDQGSIGTAGVAFAAFYLNKLVAPKFDKIHRLIRDLKGAEQDCLGGIFNKTKLWSSYLLGLNNRPFNSGANATLKRRMLELFLLSGHCWGSGCKGQKIRFVFISKDTGRTRAEHGQSTGRAQAGQGQDRARAGQTSD